MKKTRKAAPLKVICVSHWHCRACARALDCTWPARLWAALEKQAPGRFHVYHYVVDGSDADAALTHLQDKVLRRLPGVVIVHPPARGRAYLQAVRQAVAARHSEFLALPARCRAGAPNVRTLAAAVTRWADLSTRALS